MIATVTLNTAVDKLYIVEKLADYTVMRVKRVSNTAGGKCLNVSKVAALAGEEVIATGFAGGFNGQYVEALLKDQGGRSPLHPHPGGDPLLHQHPGGVHRSPHGIFRAGGCGFPR